MVKKKIMPFGICSFISLSFVLSFPPVLADSAYTLVETTSDDKSENVIVKYEYDNNTGLLTPKYYRVNLNKTEYGNPNGNQTLSFDSKYSATGKIDYKFYSPDTTGTSNERIDNDGSDINAPIDGDFFDIEGSSNGGAIYNNNAEIQSINSNFTNNRTSSDSHYANGGAIYNSNGAIQNINGNFISNYVKTPETGYTMDAIGGAIANVAGNIDKITGNFIQNFAQAISSNAENTYANSSVYGGAIYNGSDSSINEITGDFIENHAAANNTSEYSDVYGGAIYNYSSLIGNIFGDFISNYAESLSQNRAAAQGGAIYNKYSEVNDITGDFIGNYAYSEGNSADSAGGAVYNYNVQMNKITGDFIQNGAIAEGDYANAVAGAIYNDASHIENLTGDFIENYAQASGYNGANAAGGAIYQDDSVRTIVNLNGDFIKNNAAAKSNNDSQSIGGAIANINSRIINTNGDFIQNSASAESYEYANALGGAVFNTGTIMQNINGDFIENNAQATGNDTNAKGGAIYNEDSHIQNLTGDFIENHAYSNASASAYASGGAIAQNQALGTIVNLNSDFINNSATADATFEFAVPGNISLLDLPHSDAHALGGAIDNTSSAIQNITGNFSGNSAESKAHTSAYSAGGAIANIQESVINKIQGTFLNNFAAAKSNVDANALGGAIANTGITGAVTADFIGNYAKAEGENANALGGAVYNNSVFLSELQNEKPVAEISVFKIKMNDGTIKAYSSGESIEYSYIKPLIDNNLMGKVISTNIVLTENELQQIIDGLADEGAPFTTVSEFIAYMEQSGIMAEGDLGQYYEDNMQDSSSLSTSMVFENSSFINNWAKAEGENAQAKGGAIYSSNNIKIEANDKHKVLIAGNYTDNNGVIDNNAIYMASSDKYISTQSGVETYETQASALILDANTEGVIQIDDKISGDKGGGQYTIDTNVNNNKTVTKESKDGYKIYITGDNTGTVILNNDVEGEADMYLYQTTLKLGKRDDVLKNNNMTFNSGTFDMVNNNIGSTNFNTLTLNNNIKTKADVDLINETMDRITSDNYIINENKLNDKLISVDYLNLLNDSTKDSVKILYADEEISSNVEYIGSNPIQVDEDKIAYSPIYKYTVSYDIDENDNMGYFTFNRGNINDSNSYNPSVLAPSVSSQAGAYTTQLQTLEYAFKHSDAFMALPSFERMAIINADRYALTPTSDATDIGTFSPLMTKLDVSGFWVKPYTSFESIPLDNGPKVSNISYGTLVGYDSNLKHLKNGWERVLTGYIGYNGASQRYSGIDTYQNGGILGLTTTFYKNNFFNATTISTGAAVGDSSTYYGDEDYTMLTAGIGNKFGYNFEFKDGKFILQPNLLLSYTFINTFDYTNAAGLKIKSDPLHALQIAPGIKFIMNTESGWQPYLRADMIWNILDKTKVTANDVRLPEMSIDPYVQYGIGVQKLFKNERLTFFGQALVQNGGRNGVSLNAGLRWAVGKGTN